MKTVTRVILMAAVAGAFYFATIGRMHFYQFMYFFAEIIHTISNQYVSN